MCPLRLTFPIDFLPGWLIHWCKRIERAILLLYYSQCLPLALLMFTLYILVLVCLVCIHLWILYLLVWLTPLLSSNDLLCLLLHSFLKSLVCVIWVYLPQHSFGFRLHGIQFFTSSLSICVCPYFWSVSILGNIYMDLVFLFIQLFYVFWLMNLFHLLLG